MGYNLGTATDETEIEKDQREYSNSPFGPEWKQKAWGIHQRYIKQARAKGKLLTDDEICNFLALAICGEAGELANLFKKMWRGDAISAGEIRDEIADVRIYLEQLAGHLDMDIDGACVAKLRVVEQRIATKEAEPQA